MKVVLFCGGLGLRLRPLRADPKPTYTFHVVRSQDDGIVERIDDVNAPISGSTAAT